MCKKTIAFFIGAFLGAFILTGCVETPDEVKKEIIEINEAKKARQELKRNLRYVDVSELKQDGVEGNFTIDHGVFRFDGTVIIPKCEKAYLLELKVNDEIFENIDQNMLKIMKHIGTEGENWKDYIIDEDGVDTAAQKDILTDKAYGCKGFCSVKINDSNIFINQLGYLSINQKMTNGEHKYFLNGDNKIIDTYYFINDKDTTLNQVINLNGKNITLGRLNDSFENQVELINKCSPKLNLIIHDVRILEDQETNNTMAVFRALSSYKGICFDSDYILSQDSKISGGKSFVGFEMNQQMHNEEDRCSTSLRESSYLVTKEKKEIKKVIDFDSALNIIEKTVPQDKITTIESAEFIYQIYYEGEEGQAWSNVYENPPVFYAVPVWKFVEKDRPSETEATVYYVDAVTAEVRSFYEACTP